jgi:DNA repair protein RadC
MEESCNVTPSRGLSAREPSARTSHLYRTLAYSGADRLADLELVAAVLSGDEAKRRQRAESLLAEVGSLWGLLRIGVEALTELGLSPSEALRLSAALELGRRALIEPATRTAVREPIDAYRCVAPLLLGTPRERFLVVVLDVKNRPRHVACVTEGSVDTCPVDPREVFGPALRERGSAVLVAHNHPSGDPTPSAEDLALTERLAQAGQVVGVPLLDHIIVGSTLAEGNVRYVSLAERGLMRVARPSAA